MNAPPKALAAVPRTDIPPFVPGGTVRHGAVTSRGGDSDNIPSSEASVSPVHVAKWLHGVLTSVILKRDITALHTLDMRKGGLDSTEGLL